MTTLNLPLDQYDAVLGLDLVFGMDSDLAIDDLDGDLATVSGTAMVSEAVRRRITTTFQGYSRLVKASDNYLEPIGLGYGCAVATYLSNPVTDAQLDSNITSSINEAVSSDPRVAVSQTYITDIQSIQSRVGVALNYKLYKPQDLSKLDLAVGQFSIAGLAVSSINHNHQLVIPIQA
jgi:hypothetical protein